MRKNMLPNFFHTQHLTITLGISHELFTVTEELGLSKTELRTFFSFYCRSKEYKEKLILNAERINLKGEVAGLVTEEEVRYHLK